MIGDLGPASRAGQCGIRNATSNWMDGSYTAREEDARIVGPDEEEEADEGHDGTRCDVGQCESNGFGSWYAASPLLTNNMTSESRGPGYYDSRPTNQDSTCDTGIGLRASDATAGPLAAPLFRLA